MNDDINADFIQDIRGMIQGLQAITKETVLLIEPQVNNIIRNKDLSIHGLTRLQNNEISLIPAKCNHDTKQRYQTTIPTIITVKCVINRARDTKKKTRTTFMMIMSI